jgi:hypothetical protein
MATMIARPAKTITRIAPQVTWSTGRYAAAIVLTAVMVPAVALVVAAGVYVLGESGSLALVLGTVAALFAWLIGAVCVRPYCTARRADTRVFGLLQNRLYELDARLASSGSTTSARERPSPKTTPAPGAGGGSDPGGILADLLDESALGIGVPPQHAGLSDTPSASDAYRAGIRAEAEKYRDAIEAAFDDQGLPWVLKSGYVRLWELIHMLEEALIEIEPCEIVIRDALIDEARLQGSSIDGRDDLLDQLRQAVQQLSPSAAQFLIKQPPPRCPADGSGVSGPEAEAQARLVLREVRHALNEYRLDRRDGLVRARNQLVATVTVTGLGMYVLLGFSLLLNAPPSSIGAVTAFFLVGAAVGLFNRMSSQSRTDNAVDDFGLSVARLTLTPVFSGLAAVGGVLLTVMLYGAILTQFGDATSTAPTQPKDLLDIYKLVPIYLIAAAVFGLTPSMLLGGLQQQSDKLKSDLKSSQAAGRGTS